MSPRHACHIDCLRVWQLVAGRRLPSATADARGMCVVSSFGCCILRWPNVKPTGDSSTSSAQPLRRLKQPTKKDPACCGRKCRACVLTSSSTSSSNSASANCSFTCQSMSRGSGQTLQCTPPMRVPVASIASQDKLTPATCR